jgi:hypothetical protein
MTIVLKIMLVIILLVVEYKSYLCIILHVGLVYFVIRCSAY